MTRRAASRNTRHVDGVFRALSDPTRRSVLERLGSSPASVSELAEPFDMALPSFVEHLKVLEGCGLVRSRKAGRVRTYRLAPERLGLVEDWLAGQRRLWDRRLDQLDQFLIELESEGARMTLFRLPEPDPELDLVLERDIDVPRELVWSAWTKPEHLSKWFAPAPWTVVDCEIDLRPGGIFRTVTRSPDGEESTNVGCYLDVVPNERLIWTDALLPGYRPSESPFFTAVVTLESIGAGTHYTAMAIHRDEAGRKLHEEMGFHEGWGAALDQLVAHTRTM